MRKHLISSHEYYKLMPNNDIIKTYIILYTFPRPYGVINERLGASELRVVMNIWSI